MDMPFRSYRRASGGMRNGWPLSAAQRVVWLGHQLDSSSAAFNIAGYYEITGPLDARVLAEACQTVIQEAGVLRPRFVDDDEVWQVIEEDVPMHLEIVDFTTVQDRTRRPSPSGSPRRPMPGCPSSEAASRSAMWPSNIAECFSPGRSP